MQKINQPLSNVQSLAKKAIQAANKVWDEKGWTDADVDRMLNTKMRKSGK